MARGSIHAYKLADGSERWMVMYRTSNGVQQAKRGFKRPREAEAFLNQKMAAVDRGQVVSAKDSFAEYIDHWLAEHRPRLEGGTAREYEAHIERRLKPFFGAMRLSAITSADVRRYVSELVRGTGVGAPPLVAELSRARAAAERMGEFTVAEFARGLGMSSDRARSLVRKLEEEGSIVKTARFAAPHRPGPAPPPVRVSQARPTANPAQRGADREQDDQQLVDGPAACARPRGGGRPDRAQSGRDPARCP
jgi:hypothetical protein